jgi:hypothetical protein
MDLHPDPVGFHGFVAVGPYGLLDAPAILTPNNQLSLGLKSCLSPIGR